jgi:enoyl-CoA hydratase/carnithine racemase
MTMTERMIAKKDGTIGWMIFNNPERRNAVSLDMWEAIPGIMDDFIKDSAVRVIVLAGAGDKAFISGADISQFEKNRSSAESVAHYDETAAKGSNAIHHSPKPTIAMIRGYCLGGGLNTAMRCDLRIAAEDARFAIPAARLGLGYGYPGSRMLVDLVGPAYAKEIFFTARQFDAQEAWRMGLVNKVVAVADLESTVRSYAETIGANAPLTVATSKMAVDAAVRDPEDRDLKAVQASVDKCFASEDYKEGRRAFMEKRKPVFRGV